ncbi:MAG: HIT family protein [Planctomycetota bacterium]
MPTDPDCIFCKIAAGEISAEIVHEDEACVAFMDINPLAEGHVLLIPREHYATVDQVPAETAGAMLKNLPALGQAVRNATGCEGFNVLQNNGKVAHQEVMHVHFHVIPRNGGDEFHFNWPAGSYPEGRCGELADAIRNQLT